MGKLIKEAKAREMTDLDRKNFAKYEAMFESGEAKRKIRGVDMTPQQFSWQEVARADLGSFCNKPLSELHSVVDELIKKHGDDVQLSTYTYESGGGWSMRGDCAIPATTFTGIKVVKYLPVLTHEQYIAQRDQRMEDFSKNFAKQQEASKKISKERQAKMIKKIQESPTYKALKQKDPK